MKILIFLSATLILMLVWAIGCDPMQTKHRETEVRFYKKNPIVATPPTDTLKAMTYNVKFGGGRIDFFFDCFGDRVVMDSSEVIANLDALAALIRHIDPDLLFIQEADIRSKRSACIDQVEYLLNHTNLQYAAYASQWKGLYIPSKRLGQMDSGNAILSKYPLGAGKRHALSPVKDQNPVVRYFYLKRNVLECTAQIGSKSIVLLNTHTEAYSQDGTKLRQIDQIHTLASRLNQAGKAFLLAGDFNALPPHTTKTKGFPDSVCKGEFEADDFSAETEWMQPFYRDFQSDTPPEIYGAGNSRFFTHSVDKNSFWNRKLDYLFSNQTIDFTKTTTWQSEVQGGYATMPLSDHCPVSTTLILQ